MDLNYVSNVFVAKDCARTASGADDTISGQVVPAGSVQIYASTQDSGAVAASYYGPGELVITDESGLVLDATSANDPLIPAIQVHMRSFNGENHFASKAIEAAGVINFTVDKYLAPSECVVGIDTIDASLADFSYTVKITKTPSPDREYEDIPVVKTVVFRSALGGSLDTEIVTGLVDAINNKFNPDPDGDLGLKAVKNGAGDGFRIEALPKEFKLGKFRYGKNQFTVTTNFTCTLGTNVGADYTFDAVVYPKATIGVGNWEQVAELEWEGIGQFGVNKDKMSMQHVANMIEYSYQEYVDGYDILNIAWEKDYGQLGRAFQKGEILIPLPVINNAANQQQEIVDTLEAYLITAHGLKVPTPTLT